MNTEILRELGLNDLEIRIYLELIKSGDLLASGVSAKLSLHRTTSYYILENLIKKGLVSYVIKSGKKYFHATNPEKLIDIENERLIQLTTLAAELKKLKSLDEQKTFVEVYEGTDGLKTVWEDVIRSLKNKGELWIIGRGKAPKLLPYYMPNFHLRRIAKKISIKIIYNDIPESRERGRELKKMKFTTVRYLSKDHMIPMSALIYADKTVLIAWNEKLTTAVLMQDKSMNQSFRSQFDIIWSQAKE
ncbi:MAG: helix-turn-helix domain-containing protein [Candidatus Woesearchaeota archaeon]